MRNPLLLACLAAASYLNSQITAVGANPDGAGSCNGPGVAAVGGSHLDSNDGRPVVGGSLVDGQIFVTVGGVTLDSSAVNELPAGEDLLLGVEGTDITFKGVLARLQTPDGVDAAGALVPMANTRSADYVCTDENVVGITHVDNEDKNLATGIFRVDEELDGLRLDVTVVFLNLPEGSAYVYSGFDIQTRALGDEPTVAPAIGSDAPVRPSADEPIAPSLDASAAPSPGSSAETGEPTNTPAPTTETRAPTPTPTTVPPVSPSPSPSPTIFPTPLESTEHPTYYYKPKKPKYPYYPYGKGKGKMKGIKGGYYGKGKGGYYLKGAKGYYLKGTGGYYGKGKGGGMSKSSSSSSSEYGEGGHFYHNAPPQHGHPFYYDHRPYRGKGRSQELHVTLTGGNRRQGPALSVHNRGRNGGQ